MLLLDNAYSHSAARPGQRVLKRLRFRQSARYWMAVPRAWLHKVRCAWHRSLTFERITANRMSWVGLPRIRALRFPIATVIAMVADEA